MVDVYAPNVLAAVSGVWVVPEPSTYVLMGSGLLALGGIAARRRRRPG